MADSTPTQSIQNVCLDDGHQHGPACEAFGCLVNFRVPKVFKVKSTFKAACDSLGLTEYEEQIFFRRGTAAPPGYDEPALDCYDPLFDDIISKARSYHSKVQEEMKSSAVSLAHFLTPSPMLQEYIEALNSTLDQVPVFRSKKEFGDECPVHNFKSTIIITYMITAALSGELSETRQFLRCIFNVFNQHQMLDSTLYDQSTFRKIASIMYLISHELRDTAIEKFINSTTDDEFFAPASSQMSERKKRRT